MNQMRADLCWCHSIWGKLLMAWKRVRSKLSQLVTIKQSINQTNSALRPNFQMLPHLSTIEMLVDGPPEVIVNSKPLLVARTFTSQQIPRRERALMLARKSPLRSRSIPRLHWSLARETSAPSHVVEILIVSVRYRRVRHSQLVRFLANPIKTRSTALSISQLSKRPTTVRSVSISTHWTKSTRSNSIV